MWIRSKRMFIDKRRKLRLEMTDAERVLWSYLRRKKLKGRRFRRQEGIGNYIVDFYCHSEKLIIEIDGGVHLLKEQINYDERRSTYFKSQGYIELRFTNKDIFKNIDKVVEKIVNTFNES